MVAVNSIRGINKPLSVEDTSSLASGLGVVVPIPVCALTKPEAVSASMYNSFFIVIIVFVSSRYIPTTVMLSVMLSNVKHLRSTVVGTLEVTLMMISYRLCSMRFLCALGVPQVL